MARELCKGSALLDISGRFFGDGLPVAAFQNLVGLQGDLQQGYQGFHLASRLSAERGPDRVYSSSSLSSLLKSPAR